MLDTAGAVTIDRFSQRREEMFEKGDYVVYGTRGVCLIRDIAPVDLPGVDRDRLYYIMCPVQGGSGTVYLPIDSTKAVIRRVMSEQEARQLIDDIPRIEQLRVEDDKNREASYKEAMRSCSSRAWVSVIKTLSLRKRERIAAGKKITALDERYLKAAEQELYGELSVALGIPRDEMESYIQDHMGKKRENT